MVDYSKWKDIEISDDEDDTHPNIDTPSLFRWRHQARVERMEEMQKDKDIHSQKVKDVERKISDVQEKLKNATHDEIELDALRKSLEEAVKEKEALDKLSDELQKKEKKAPWNVDTISHAGFSKTVVNVAPKRKEDEMTEEEKEKKMKEFVQMYEKEIKEYGLLQKYDDSKRYLQDHLYLVCEDTANYLVSWCINLEMREKTNLMEHVAHQCICMQYMLELSKQLDVDPRACVGSFFSRIQIAEEEYKNNFDDELSGFKNRIRKRAAEKLEIALKEVEEEERLKRLGPGGLDPVEVFETLPEVLQKCFESKSISALQDAIAAMPEEEAKYHMKRCVDSGLWVPDANKANADQAGDAESAS